VRFTASQCSSFSCKNLHAMLKYEQKCREYILYWLCTPQYFTCTYWWLAVAQLTQTSPCQLFHHYTSVCTTISYSSSSCHKCKSLDPVYSRNICSSTTVRKKWLNWTKTRTRSSATAKSTARPSCLVGVLYDISREKICWWLINHFYVIGHESYRIRWNNAK